VIVTGGATDYLFVRPDTSAAADDFDSTSGNLTCNAHISVQNAASVTGEMIWGNFFTQGSLTADNHVYIFQNGSRVTEIGSATEDWWLDGHVDRAIPITDWTTDAFPVIDSGYLTVFSHKYTDKYSPTTMRMNTTSGGNVSAPLSTGVDSNNQTGYASITFTAGSGSWNVGDRISGDTSGALAIITQIDNPGSTQTLHYYLYGDPLTNFQTAAEGITNDTTLDTGTKDGNAPADEGPADAAWFDGSAAPTIVFANTTADIDDDSTAEPYGYETDVNQASLAQLYEWFKYVARRGSTFDLDGLDGQEFIGMDYRVNYTGSVTGTVGEGSVVTGVTSGASGTVVSHDTTNKVLLLRNSRGTFVDAEQIQVDAGNYIPASGTTVTAITPIAECWAGTFAGGAFFGAIGHLISDYKTTEENSFTLFDANGIQRQRPTSVSMVVSNLLDHDWVACHRLDGSGGSTNKTEYTAVGGEAVGDDTLVTGAITADTPGKATGGRLVLVDVTDSNKEYVLRYSSWATATFTLANIVVLAEAGTGTTTIVDTGVFANAEVGDLVLNKDRANAVSYITEVTDNDTVQIFPAIAGQTTGDNIEINAVPVITTSSDKVYVPILLSYVDGVTSVSASMQYLALIYTRCRVRNTSAATLKIKPYVADITIDSGGGAAVATRIENTVYGS
jgi:hypothetical protein